MGMSGWKKSTLLNLREVWTKFVIPGTLFCPVNIVVWGLDTSRTTLARPFARQSLLIYVKELVAAPIGALFWKG